MDWDSHSTLYGREVFSCDEQDLFSLVVEGKAFIKSYDEHCEEFEYFFRWKGNFCIKVDSNHSKFVVNDEKRIRNAYIMALQGEIFKSDYREFLQDLKENEGICLCNENEDIFYYKKGHYYSKENKIDLIQFIYLIISEENEYEMRFMNSEEIELYL